MNKINYDHLMLKEIENFTFKPSILLHSCCGPCSSSVLEKLQEHFIVTVFYSNSNIYPLEEFEKRLNEQKRFLQKLGINIIVDDYNQKEFYDIAKGLETLKEGDFRCYKCYEMRMEKTAKLAKELNFDYFCTTLSVSPHKNSDFINEIGINLQNKYDIKFLPSDFKKRNGYLRSLQLSKENNFYRQNYCGCVYSFNSSQKDK